MFPESLQKILNLIKTTGDRLVIFDANDPENSYVIMDIDNYAALRGKDEIMAPRLKTAAKPAPTPSPAPDQTPTPPPTAAGQMLFSEISAEEENLTAEEENLTEDDLTDTINREILMWKNRDNAPYLGEANKPKHPWQIPPQVKIKAQEVG